MTPEYEQLDICSIFFFSSRRRHTRLQGDWSSDVCSSDLHAIVGISVVGVIVTPSNDLFTMMVMIVPVMGLYMGSIWLVALIEKKRAALGKEIGRASCRERV